MKEIVAKNQHRFTIAPYTDDAYQRALRTMAIKRGPDEKSANDVEAVMEMVRLLMVDWTLPDGTRPLEKLDPPKARHLIATTPGLSDAVLKWAKEAKAEHDAGFETDSGN